MSSQQELIGIHCSACFTKTFPKREFCPNCRSRELTEWNVPQQGTIYSYTVINFPIDKYDDAPYYVGLIAVSSEKKPLITAQLKFKEGQDLQIGQKVTLAVIKNYGPYQRNIVIATLDE